MTVLRVWGEVSGSCLKLSKAKLAWQGNKGLREQGNKGAREQGNKGTREQGSKGLRE